MGDDSEKAVIEVIVDDVSTACDNAKSRPDADLELPPVLSPQEERRLWRKRQHTVGNAKLEGLLTQLKLTGSKYNIALMMYFVSYFCFAIPSNLVLKQFRPSRWLSGITMAWGLVTTLMGIVKTYPQLLGTRLCLGMVESGLACGVFYHFTLWYPRHMLHTRMGIFIGGASFAGAFSGLLAYGISFMSGTAGLLGWSWIFIIEGLITVVVGFIALFLLVDFPSTATFLTPHERAYIIHRLKYDNSSVGEEEHLELRHIREAVLDWQVWTLSIINMINSIAVYGITLFLPYASHSTRHIGGEVTSGRLSQIHHKRVCRLNSRKALDEQPLNNSSFGFGPAISQLLSVPPYVVATVSVVMWGVWSDHLKKRSPFVAAGLVLCFVGFAINLANVSIGAKYFGTFLIVIGGYSGYPAITAWLPNNLAGHYKRGVGIAMQLSFSSFGGIIASNIYRTQDAPRYILGHALEMGFMALGLLLVPPTVLLYTRINMRRKEMRYQEETAEGKWAPEDLRRLGDRAPDFKYTI
ncbi:MFS general substrate transporter [Lentinus tigrinus ALCF2SS1-7]|uniref:MFS general substrate transporter n=1 Tax=Lentinus tigrinus ALCF2SS1-6 TaxID=1328759 RepID=A0A5C2S9P1_9APHY|nr:MFS general substrate transporter [Lentinus tigrinus ALCF2SS1-6]RPD75773.1 MFS general substrate transporter [Lentinus tigrinus ALCF2SS1-7]